MARMHVLAGTVEGLKIWGAHSDALGGTGFAS